MFEIIGYIYICLVLCGCLYILAATYIPRIQNIKRERLHRES